MTLRNCFCGKQAMCDTNVCKHRVPPLTEGMVNKGGHNAFPSQVTERPPPPAPVKLKDVDFAQVEMRVVFMAGWDACFAKRDAEGNVPADADDRADAQKAFEEFVKNYGG